MFTRIGFWSFALALAISAYVGAMTARGEDATIHVSPTGSDADPGTLGQPAATLKHAVELARALPAGAAHRIFLSSGIYYDSGVTLASRDSGLIVESPKDKPALLVGGVRLSGWTKLDDRFWAARLPLGREWDVRLLVVDGRFCPRARFPETGTLEHLTVFDVPWMSSTGGGWKRKPTHQELTTLKYRKGDMPADLDIASAEVTVFHMWDESVAGIAKQDAAGGIFTLSPPLGHPAGAFGVKKFCIWNIAQGMTRPGQWYFDRTGSRIVYWPLPGEDMTQAAAIVPTQRVIVRLAGAERVTIRNLGLEVTTAPLVTGGFGAANFKGAIELHNANGATLSNLTVSNVAGQAIKAMANLESVRIENCAISNCGAGGVYISGSKNLVTNNLIHDVGLMFPSALGINGGGRDSTLSHNEIFDTSYSAIDFGGQNDLIEGNSISRCMKVMHDGAAIYTFGSKKTVMRGNYAHDIVDTGGYGASAYYLDEQSEDCVVEDNVSVGIARPSHNHMAKNNTLRNNVFITDGDMRLTFPRSSGFTLEGNVLYAGGRIEFEGVNAVSTWSKNIVYSGSGKFEGTELHGYAAAGKSKGLPGDTLQADPRFMNLGKLDLKYRPDSPAIGLGLKPLDFTQAGRK